MYHKVQDLREKGFSYHEIALEVGSTRTTATKHAKMDLSQAKEYFEKGVQRKSEFDDYLDFLSGLFQKYPRIKRSMDIPITMSIASNLSEPLLRWK